MAKQRANLTTIGQFLGDTQQPYIAAPLIAAPFSSITDLSGAVRRMPDPSQSLRPALGIERIMTRSLVLKQDETDSAGRPIWEADNKDARIRFAGNWIQEASVSGVSVQTLTNNDYMEVSFYGTGLNLLTYTNGTRDVRVSVDGGAEGANIYPGSGSALLTGRNYSGNVVVPVVSGLSLGNHTARFRFNGSANSLLVFGVEILNTSASNIIIPKGSVISAGENATIAAQTSTAFNLGFDGNPVLNGRGGRVVVYATPEGRVGKVIQQVDATTLTLGSTNHSNEELIRKINWREFAASRGDDFSGSWTNANRTFTLEDGTTALLAFIMSTNTAFTGIDAMAWGASTGFWQITFVGTGLDFEVQTSGTGTFAGLLALSIDGGAEQTFAPAIARTLRQPLVSGLPYGTHTVRVRLNTGVLVCWTDVYIYGPKKPTIPDNAVQIAEYNLMANYGIGTVTSAGNQADNPQMLQGVLRKTLYREINYRGSGTFTLNNLTGAPQNTTVGGVVSNPTNGAIYEYTFFGTGVVLYLNRNATANTDFTVAINGVLSSTGTVLTTGSGTNLGAGSYRTIFSAAQDCGPNRIEFSGLPLGRHTITITKTAGVDNLNFTGFDIITPVHFPAGRVGSMSIGDLELINRTAQKPVLDLSKAKAWVVYDQQNQRIISSNNVAAALSISTGVCRIYLEKPFKNSNYVVVSSAEDFGSGAAKHLILRNKFASSIEVTMTDNANNVFNGVHHVAFFWRTGR